MFTLLIRNDFDYKSNKVKLNTYINFVDVINYLWYYIKVEVMDGYC